MSRILVTGATGFLGRHVVDTLLEAGPDPIRILFRNENPWAGDPRVEGTPGDITDRDSVARAVSGVAVVLHLAGIVRRDPASADLMRRVHVEGTRNVCESALREPGKRVVVASSSGTFAVSREPLTHTETSPFAIDVTRTWPYYVSKIEQERLASSYHEPGRIEIVTLSPSILLGPGDIHRSSTNDVRAFLDRKIPNVPSGGLNFVDVRDAARAFVSATEAGRGGERYLLGGHNMTIREFFELLERVSGVPRPRLVLPEWLARTGAALLRRASALAGSKFPVDDQSVQMAYRYWYCDSSKARRDLRFEVRPAEVTLRDTITDILGDTDR